MSTENEYVATALAEKRLREVLAERLGDDPLAHRLGDILLAVSEIEYLPRKKAVSIRLRIPETATLPKPTVSAVKAETAEPVTVLDDPVDGSCQRCGGDGCPACSAVELPHDRGVVAAAPGTVGRFQPRAIDPSDYDDEGAFFTE